MLWSSSKQFLDEPFEKEDELEKAVIELARPLFGDARFYLDVKKKIGGKGKIQNIPDGYLLDLSSRVEPKLYVVENELETLDPLEHIALQILKFSLSFEKPPQQVKGIVRDCLAKDKTAFDKCAKYAVNTGYENVDLLLEKNIRKPDAFNALVIIDEASEELKKVLWSRFKFPVEILTIQRHTTLSGERMYHFEPFLNEIGGEIDSVQGQGATSVSTIDPSNLDTVVVPAQAEGFEETFIGENRWYQIRINSSMIPKIKYIAAYRVAPESAITHVAAVKNIERWKDTAKSVLNFSEPAKAIGPIKLLPKPTGKVKAPQAPRYTSFERLMKAKNLDEAF
jgi:hypothetical protein